MATRIRSPAPSPPFVAHVYENDYCEIQKLVQQYPNIETGGDLFGLWQDDKTVVIQLFIGPGKDCRRTTTSFHQDIEYLHRVGSVITTEGGLCNVGEWHSHHQIGMPEPSAGDRRTVFNNMPQLGLERFVLFIATIGSTRPGKEANRRTRDVKLEQINLRCFLFLGSTHEMVNGEIEIIHGSNPHRIHNGALRAIEDGAEKTQGKAPASSDEQSASKRPKTNKPDEKKPTAQTAADKIRKSEKGNQATGSNNENRSPNITSTQDRGTQGNLSASPYYGPTQAWGGGTQVQSINSHTSQVSQHSHTSPPPGVTQRNIQYSQSSSHMSQPPHYDQQPASQATAWDQGSQGKIPLFSPHPAAQHSSHATQAKPAGIPVTGLSREGFF